MTPGDRRQTKRNGGRALSRDEVYFNNLHEFVRNRIENVIGHVKAHRIFKRGCYQGPLENLVAMVHIVGHVTAYVIRCEYPRFTGYGPWHHI